MFGKTVQYRYYERETLFPSREDTQTELKGHKCLAVEEIPPWCYKYNSTQCTKRAVSRTINAFLNSDRGGRVYLGVADDRRIIGIKLSQHQKDHFRKAMRDLMSRYDPPVYNHQYIIQFIPAIEKGAMFVPKKTYDDIPANDDQHQFRTHMQCWCDQSASETDSDFYVIEIQILSYVNEIREMIHGFFMDVKPIYADEEGKTYFRRYEGVFAVNRDKIIDIRRKTFNESIKAVSDRVKIEIDKEMTGKGLSLTVCVMINNNCTLIF